ncbi:MAG TPA: hypothetical protein VFY93_10945 [Planctomycetota bacterium]|nr:hypothetical protein [Planctomycetota bacterium]
MGYVLFRRAFGRVFLAGMAAALFGMVLLVGPSAGGSSWRAPAPARRALRQR